MAVADSVVTFLLQNLSRMLDEEVKLLSGTEGKISSLCKELKFMDIFLKSCEGKRNDPLVKEVVNQIIDVAHKAEDVVDTYIANISKQDNRSKLKKLLHSKDHAMILHDVNAEIEKIRSCIDEIYKNKDRYSIIGEGEFTSGDNEAAVQIQSLLRKRRNDVEEEDVVHDSTVVLKHLLENDSRRCVVSIIGMGGLGKTTLARKIYNNDQVKQLFPCRAWGYVSNNYRAKELLLSLLRCLMMSSTSEYVDLSEEELKKKVQECLKGKKYLLVLDDIWNTQVWDEIQDAFPNDDHSCSRILITSRIKEVASHARPTLVYHLFPSSIKKTVGNSSLRRCFEEKSALLI